MESEIYWITSSVKTVTVKKNSQIILLQGKAKNLQNTPIFVYVLLIKVSQNDHFWVAPGAVFL